MITGGTWRELSEPGRIDPDMATIAPNRRFISGMTPVTWSVPSEA
jgi:hypothetical protein